MPSDDSAAGYFIWGVDHAVYGPVELPTLVGWIKEERVTADTWLFVERSDCWEKAVRVAELQMFFHSHLHSQDPAMTSAPATGPAPDSLSPGALRHVKILACLSEEQIERFVRTMEVQAVPNGAQVTKQGEQGDAMYLVLEGELRLRAMVEGRETALGALGAGEYFGEISLFDHGPRSATAVATQDSALLKMSASQLEKLIYEAPDLAAPVLFAIARTLTTRVRSENKRYHDSLSFVHTAPH
jgi:CRP-like cAMP-binding protein